MTVLRAALVTEGLATTAAAVVAALTLATLAGGTPGTAALLAVLTYVALRSLLAVRWTLRRERAVHSVVHSVSNRGTRR